MEEHATRSMAISKIQIVEKYAAKQPEFFNSQIVRERKECKRKLNEKKPTRYIKYF